jgi:protein-S-isoprenylcysteine O-methyltransferase Ste14
MRPLAYTSPYCWIFLAIFLWAYLLEYRLIARSRGAPKDKADRGSMAVIMVVSWFGSFAAFLVAAWPPFAIVHARLAWFVAGLCILIVGRLLRMHCWRMLGEHFTGNVKVLSDQPVIDRGAYRWVRHPSYTGGILMYLGTGLALTNWLSSLLIAGAGALGYIYRVIVEERALQENLGGRYQEYMRRTKRFVPFIF